MPNHTSLNKTNLIKSNLVLSAMGFAFSVHQDQRRKYTNAPYVEHLAQVAGLVASVSIEFSANADVIIATAWLHDCVEDQEVTLDTLESEFGLDVAQGVSWLTETDMPGNRAQRKAIDCDRLARAPGWVQTIKCADIISNTASVAQFDPNFAKTYLHEKALTLDVLNHADPRLREIARSYCRLETHRERMR